MKINELRRKLDAEDDGAIPANLVMAQDVSTGLPYSIKDVVTETHEDGSVTTWIKIEEY